MMSRARISNLWGKITVFVVICCCSLPAQAKYGGGTGEPNDPYQIKDANHMQAIGADANDWDKHFKLMADIDLSAFTGTSFNIIGYRVSSDDYNPFTGVFDGNGHIISNFTYTSTGTDYVGLFGCVGGVIKDLGLIDPNVDAGTGNYVGALVGIGGTITGCYVEGGSVSGDDYVGGLAGGIGSLDVTVTDCYATCSVLGNEDVGGLVGFNNGSIYKCYSAGSVTGTRHVGGLAGLNMAGFVGAASIFNCYSRGSVSGNSCVGGLVGYNLQSAVIHECYSSGSVTGTTNVGGLVGCNDNVAPDSFWDTQTSGQTWSDGGTGLPTAEMQTQSTFTDAGWDFITPVWTIDEGVDYPRLWWELLPVLHAEPEVTLGTSNTIYWEPVPGANDYYAECAEDANFTNILYSTGWITETSYEFTGLELGQRYWYSVKARNSAGIESAWSNVESSLQCTLSDAVDMMLDPDTQKNKNMKNALLNKICAVQQMLDKGRYEEALNKLQNDILQKTDGCAETGRPDKNDWIITCEGQGELYPLVMETIEHVKGLMNQ